MVEAFFYATDV